MYAMYIGGVLFPVTPPKMTLKINSQNKTVTLINEGEVNLIKTPGLTDISVDKLLLPLVTKYPFALYEGDEFKRADYYLGKLEEWKKSKTPVSFVLSRTSPDGSKLLFDTNMTVTIEDYEVTEDADDQGLDLEVKLEMKEYRYWGSKKLVVKKKTSSKKAAVKKKIRKTKAKPKTYTVKKGDCLYNIAKKQLGSSAKWKKIYQLNKTVIENTAKKHGRKSSSNGHWIWPGTKLKLPS